MSQHHSSEADDSFSIADNAHHGLDDRQFTKLFSLMIGFFLLLTVALIGLGIYMASDVTAKLDVEKQADRDRVVARRVQPVETLNLGAVAANTEVAAVAQSGEAVYTSVCTACHGAGVAGAPKTGDAAAWEARVAQGMDTVYTHAIEGYQGEAGYMPAKGGNPALSDDEVKAAVDYMLEQ